MIAPLFQHEKESDIQMVPTDTGTYKSGIPEIAYQVYPSQLSEKDIFKKVLDHDHVVLSYWLAIDLQIERKLCSVRAVDKK